MTPPETLTSVRDQAVPSPAADGADAPTDLVQSRGIRHVLAKYRAIFRVSFSGA